MKKKLFSILTLFILIGALLACGKSTDYTPSAPVRTGKWTITHKWIGTGDKKTGIITVPDYWKITYTCYGDTIAGTRVDGALAITLYQKNFTQIGLPIDEACKVKTSDSIYEHTPGAIYFDITVLGPWSIQIQELK
ncbi:MAG: hypothetical protein H0V70_18550 [Ktedonobacteraceae bacterium]|nr:hypothetical protein [Ktedonobacteraceae bacterium]